MSNANTGRSFLYACAALSFMVLPSAFSTPVAAAAPSAWDEIKQSGTIKVGLIPQLACYYWRDSDDDAWKGFPVRMGTDATTELGKQMGEDLKIEWVPTSWGNSILDLQSGKIDAFFGLGITEERQKAVNMFGPIYAVPEVLVVHKDATIGNTWNDLNKPEVRISTIVGTTEEEEVKENAPNAQLRLMQTSDLAFLDVQSGNSDVYLETVITGLAAAKKAGGMKLLLLDPYTAGESGGAVRKDEDGKLADFMQKWGTEYRDSGALQKTVLSALEECGLDVSMMPEGTKF